MRKHNIVAKGLANVNPHWDDERLFQETRKIIIAIMQHTTYNEFLPEIVGPDEMTKNGLFSNNVGFFKKYNSKVNPDLANSFSGAAFRFGHSMIEGVMKLATGCPFGASSRLSSLLEKPDFLLKSPNGVSGVLAGLCSMNAQKVDRFITEEVRNSAL